MGRRRCCCSSSGTSTWTCDPCNIPQKDLVVHWTNPFIGDGSATLVYAMDEFLGPTWTSACSNELTYSLTCNGGSVDFSATYYLSGGCPNGQAQSCESLQAAPNGITEDSHTCSPFEFNYSINNSTCPQLASLGFTGFRVAET